MHTVSEYCRSCPCCTRQHDFHSAAAAENRTAECTFVCALPRPVSALRIFDCRLPVPGPSERSRPRSELSSNHLQWPCTRIGRRRPRNRQPLNPGSSRQAAANRRRFSPYQPMRTAANFAPPRTLPLCVLRVLVAPGPRRHGLATFVRPEGARAQYGSAANFGGATFQHRRAGCHSAPCRPKRPGALPRSRLALPPLYSSPPRLLPSPSPSPASICPSPSLICPPPPPSAPSPILPDPPPPAPLSLLSPSHPLPILPQPLPSLPIFHLPLSPPSNLRLLACLHSVPPGYTPPPCPP